MPDKFINTADSIVHDLAFALRLGDVVKNGLDHEVAKLIIDENFNAFKADADQVLLPLTLRRRDAVLDHLAPVLIPRYRRKVLHNGLKNDRPSLIRPDQVEALS